MHNVYYKDLHRLVKRLNFVGAQFTKPFLVIICTTVVGMNKIAKIVDIVGSSSQEV